VVPAYVVSSRAIPTTRALQGRSRAAAAPHEKGREDVRL
jgi:hypothetical protein